MSVGDQRRREVLRQLSTDGRSTRVDDRAALPRRAETR